MMIPSDKANMRAAEAVDFARRHKWAKYPCLAAVSVVYSSEYIRLKAVETAESIKASVCAPFRPLGGRIVSFFLSGTFAFMVMPFAAVSAYADETESQYAETQAVELPSVTYYAESGQMSEEAIRSAISSAEQEGRRLAELHAAAQEENKPEVQETAEEPPKDEVSEPEPEDISAGNDKKVTLAGIAEKNEGYDIVLNIGKINTDITARFLKSPKYLDKVVGAFEGYGISTEELNIEPVDVTIYTTEGRQRLRLKEGYSADITLPIPKKMHGHTDDLKVVRLEKDNSMTVLDGVINGDSISFNTEHFSVFALVSYRDKLTTASSGENIGSGAGMASAGVVDTAVSAGANVFEEDKRRFKKERKRKIYRIKRIAKDKELLLL